MSLLDAQTSRPLEGGPSYSLGNRLFRVFWTATWCLLARWTPPPLHRWRVFLLKLFGARIGSNARIYASAKIWNPRNLQLGRNATIGPNSRIYNQGLITIGARSTVSQYAYLCASSHDISDPNFQLILRPIVIGKDCWIAADAFVGPGVTMDDQSILAARAALFEDAAAGGVYRGNPAQKIKDRGLATR